MHILEVDENNPKDHGGPRWARSNTSLVHPNLISILKKHASSPFNGDIYCEITVTSEGGWDLTFLICRRVVPDGECFPAPPDA